uniref:Probable cyclin-dependent serine/threonine-protein kinase DDB_G0292550 n=1 Tax=Dermatophagoides pteronyssinus TaxID=6956 RepID=A0A6P6Y4I3_DERPT|nr:probable cyclin-dependent serine/threonine-protein kinase DDB_G0292550 [Dermatophagoides pteronyssinus]
MFTFAQYVFGVGRSLENSNNSNDNENNQTLENSTALSLQQQSNNNNNNCNNKQLENPSTTLSSTTSSSSSGCYENDSESNCSLTNIENDWILIDHAKAKNKNQEKKVKSKLPNITIASNSNNKNPTAIKTLKNNKNEKWLVDPPECFKPGKRKNHHEKSIANDNDNDDDDEKTEEMENLLIEHPSMSVFDDLFVKKPNPITLATVQRPSCSIVNSATIKQSLSSMNKAEQRKIILARIQQSLKNNKENGGNNNNKKSKSNGTGSSSSSQTLNNVPLAQLNGNNNKALIATIIDSNDKNDYRKNKKQITKKQYQRQNKNIQQRNGPIIRQKKMFTHINGIYHNRNNC